MGSVIKELVQRGHDMAADLNASCGAVDVLSVAKLISELASQLDVQLVRGNQVQQQLAAVVAENAGLKEFCKNAAFDADYEAELCMERGGFTDALNDIQTPATDAAIANIQAQGVEGFLTFCGEENSVFVEAKAYYRSLADAVDEFAAQLRQGEKQ